MADFVFADDFRLDQGPTRRFFEQFLKGFVHKHNNLMGVIQGFSSLILYDDSIGADVRENAEQMQSSAKIATELNRDVLAASGCARCDLAPIQLADSLPYWKSKSEEICAAEGTSLTLDARPNLPLVMADSTRLGELYFHLLRNAAESAAQYPGSPVAVDIFPPGEASPGQTVDLFIRNRSAECDEAALTKCFQPFETTKGSGHFGIGLTAAAVLAGDMRLRLGLRWADGIMTTWLAIPLA